MAAAVAAAPLTPTVSKKFRRESLAFFSVMSWLLIHTVRARNHGEGNSQKPLIQERYRCFLRIVLRNRCEVENHYQLSFIPPSRRLLSRCRRTRAQSARPAGRNVRS